MVSSWETANQNVSNLHSLLAGVRPTRGHKEHTLVVANRHEIAGAGIEALLQAAGHSVVARYSRERDLRHAGEGYCPDIIMLAENISQDAAKTVFQLRARNCSAAIIFLFEERDAISASALLDLDVEGILSSAASAASIIDCVESVGHGRKWLDPDLLRHLAAAEAPSEIASSLTLRETEIAHLVSRGLRNKEIAHQLHLSEGTIKMHLHHIYNKLHLGGRAQLALWMAGACARMSVSGIGAGPLEEPGGQVRVVDHSISPDVKPGPGLPEPVKKRSSSA